MVNETITIIKNAYKKDIESNGSFWRITRLDTFVDLLMLQAGKASIRGIDDKLAMEVILTAIKAIVNGKLGIKDYTTEHEQLNKELLDEQELVYTEVEHIIEVAISQSESDLKSLPLSDDLNYFKVLSNLEIDNYSLDVFENILSTFISYFISKN